MMLMKSFLCLLAAVTAPVYGQEASIPISSIDLEIFHSNLPSTSGDFTSRGIFSVNLTPEGKKGLDPLKNGIFDEASLDSFKKLLDKNALYQISIRKIGSNINETTQSIISSIPACELQKSGFKEDIIVHLDSNNNPIGVAYSAPVIALSRPCDSSKLKIPLHFHTRVKVAEKITAQSVPLHATGPPPLTMQKINFDALTPDGKLDPTKQVQPPQTFLQKYWYIVLAMVIYMFLGNVKDEATKDAKKKE